MNKDVMGVQEVSPGYEFVAENPAVPVGYKQTEVGVIPEDWDLQRLGELAKFRTGPFGSSLHKSDYVTGGIPVINPMHIVDGQLFPSSNMSVREETAARLSEFRLQEGDIVLGRRGDMGRCAVVRKQHAGWLCGTGSMIVRPGSEADPHFLQRILSSQEIIALIENSSVGSTMINLNQSTLIGLPVKFPSQSEQLAIATALSDVDALLEELDRLIAKKRDIKQAAMQQLLTGETRLPGFEGEWVTKLLGEIAHIKTGGKNNEDKREDGDFPFFVRSATVERISTYSYDCEAILVPGEGQIGSIFHYVDGKFDVHQRVYAITQFSDEVSGRYIHLYMSKHFGSWAMQNTVKATVDSLRLPTFQTFELKLPPTPDEQIAIAEYLFDVDAEIQALEHRRSKTAELKQGMMQELLTGRTRLV